MSKLPRVVIKDMYELTTFVLLAIAARPTQGRSTYELLTMFKRTRFRVEDALSTLFTHQLIKPCISHAGHAWYPTAKLQQVLDDIHAQDAAVTSQCLRARAAVRGQRSAHPVPTGNVSLAPMPDVVEPDRTTRRTPRHTTDSRQRPERLDGLRSEVVGPNEPDVADRPRDLDGEHPLNLKDRVDYALHVQTMTAPWPKPTPPYILEIVDRNYETGKTAFAAAGEVRGQMIRHGHDVPTPHSAPSTRTT
jgi:hypothetical protein